MKKILLGILLLINTVLFAQIQIGTNMQVMSQELLDYKGSVNTYAELAIILADTGQLTYVIDSLKYFIFNGTEWLPFASSEIWTEDADTAIYTGTARAEVVETNNIDFKNTDIEDVLTFNTKPVLHLSSGKTSTLVGYYNGLNSNTDAAHMQNATVFGYRNYVNSKWFNIGSLFGYNNVVSPALIELTDSLITEYWTLGEGWTFSDPVGLNKNSDGLGTVTPVTWTTIANEIYTVNIKTGTVGVSGVSITLGGVTSPTTITMSDHNYTILIETINTGGLIITPLLTSARIEIESISVTKSFYLDNNNTNAWGYNNFNYSSITEDSGMYQTNGAWAYGSENGTAMELANNVYLYGNNLMDGNIEPNVASVKDKMIFGLSMTGDVTPTLSREGIMTLSNDDDEAVSYANFNFDEIRLNGERLSLGLGDHTQMAIYGENGTLYGTNRVTYDSTNGMTLWQDKLTLYKSLNFTNESDDDVITMDEQPFLKIFGSANSCALFGLQSGQLSWIDEYPSATTVLGFQNAIEVGNSVALTIIGSQNVIGTAIKYYYIGLNGDARQGQIVIGTGNLKNPTANRSGISLDQFAIIGNDCGAALDSLSSNFYLYGNSLYNRTYDVPTLLTDKMIFGIRESGDYSATNTLTSIILDAKNRYIDLNADNILIQGNTLESTITGRFTENDTALTTYKQVVIGNTAPDSTEALKVNGDINCKGTGYFEHLEIADGLNFETEDSLEFAATYFNVADGLMVDSDSVLTHGDSSKFVTPYDYDTLTEDQSHWIGSYNNVVLLVSGDATPDVSNGTLLSYVNATDDVVITDLDNPIPNTIYNFVGGNAPMMFQSSGNFRLNDDTIYLFNGDVLPILCISDNDYVQYSPLSRNSNYDYYVSTTGNDANDGLTIETAWLTIGKAETTTTDGQTMLILPGTYDSPAVTFDQNVTWYGYGVIVTDSVTVTTTLWTMSGTDQKTFYGFTFECDNTTTQIVNGSTSNVNNQWHDCSFNHNGATDYVIKDGYYTMTGCYLQCGDVGLSQFSYTFEFEDCILDSLRGNGIYNLDTHLGTMTVDGGTLNLLSGNGAFYIRRDGWHNIQGTTINTLGAVVGLINTASGGTGSQNLLIENCTMNETVKATTAFLYTPNSAMFDTIYIRDNTINSGDFINGSSIRISADDTCAISGNLVINNSDTTYSAIVYVPDATSSKVYIGENQIQTHAVGNYGILVGSDATGGAANNTITGLVEKNYILCAEYYSDKSWNNLHGIIIGHQVGVSVKYNWIEGAKYGIIYKNKGNNTTGTCEYNIIKNCQISLYSKGAKDVKYYGNTLYVNNTNFDAAFYIASNAVGEFSDSTRIINNICYYTLGAGDLLVNEDNTGLSNHVINYNCIYATSGTVRYAIDGVTYSSWALIQAGGWEVNGINEDPMFATGQCYVRESSPVIGAGLDLGSPYDYGLDVSTVFDSLIVTAIQPANWYIGAYSQDEGDL